MYVILSNNKTLTLNNGIGILYRRENYEDAIEYYNKSCEKNHLYSKFRLANLYNKEKNVPEEARTPDPMIKSHVLYRLSYRHI